MGNALITLGIFFLLFGIILNAGFPKFPGDIFIQKESFTLYFPIVTSVLISIILTIVFNVFK